MRPVNLPALVAKLMQRRRPRAKHGVEALRVLRAIFQRCNRQVFWKQQLQTVFEPYWSDATTANALGALVRNEELQTERYTIAKNADVRFYWSNALAEPNAAIERQLEIIRKTAGGDIGRRIGAHAEHLTLEAFEKLGGKILARDTSTFDGRKPAGDVKARLDAIIEIQGLRFGAEVKNMLGHPDRFELYTKRLIAEDLGVRPILITRAAPANVDEHYRALGGFVWRLGRQVYPPNRAALGRALKKHCGLPVEVCAALTDADHQTLQRHIAETVEMLTAA